MNATATASTTSTHEIEIFLSARPEFEQAMAKLNKGLAKKGFAPVAAAFGEPYRKKAGEDMFLQPIFRTAVLATVSFSYAKIGGWGFVAKAERLGEMAVVSTTPGYEDRDLGPREWDFCRCDHCGHRRGRKAVFILEDEQGKELQVGSSCLQDFLGYDPTGLLWALSAWKEMVENCSVDPDEDIFRGAGRSSCVSLQKFCTAAACAVRVLGWVSGAKAADTELTATSSTACRILFPLSGDNNAPKREPVDGETARKAIEWAGALQGKNDFERNLLALVAAGYCTHKHYGLAAAIVGCYLRELGELKEAEVKAKLAEQPKAESTYWGTVGKRESVEVEVLFTREISTFYGVSTLVKMVTPAGQLLTWFASGASPDEGEKFTLTCTVKRHEVYNGEKQTMVTRCKGF